MMMIRLSVAAADLVAADPSELCPLSVAERNRVNYNNFRFFN